MNRALARRIVLGLAAMVSSACSLVLDTDALTKDFGPEAGSSSGGSPTGDGGELDGGGTRGPSAYRDAVLADAPVAYFRLDETAAPAKSLVGGFTATASGTPSFGVPGALAGDRDLAFDPEGRGGLSAGTVFDFTGTQPFTCEAWISITSIDDRFRFVLSKTIFLAGQRESYALYATRTGDGNRLVFERWTGGQSRIVSVSAPSLGTYHHVAAVYDGGALTLWVDGAAAGTTPDTRSSVAKPVAFTIGTVPAPDVELQPFRGSIDELAVYDKALGGERILAHRDIGLGR